MLASVSLHVLQPHETEVLKKIGLIQCEATHSVGDFFHFISRGVLSSGDGFIFAKSISIMT